MNSQGKPRLKETRITALRTPTSLISTSRFNPRKVWEQNSESVLGIESGNRTVNREKSSHTLFHLLDSYLKQARVRAGQQLSSPLVTEF